MTRNQQNRLLECIVLIQENLEQTTRFSHADSPALQAEKLNELKANVSALSTVLKYAVELSPVVQTEWLGPM